MIWNCWVFFFRKVLQIIFFWAVWEPWELSRSGSGSVGDLNAEVDVGTEYSASWGQVEFLVFTDDGCSSNHNYVHYLILIWGCLILVSPLTIVGQGICAKYGNTYEHKDRKIGFRDWFHMPLGRDFPTFSYVSWSIVDFQFPRIFEARTFHKMTLPEISLRVWWPISSDQRVGWCFTFNNEENNQQSHNLNINSRSNWDIWWIIYMIINYKSQNTGYPQNAWFIMENSY